jgi:hypothetical protein
MKTEEVTRVVGFCLIIIVAGIFLTGCATGWQAYSGPALPRKQVAVLKTPAGFSGQHAVCVNSVDGRGTGTHWDGSPRFPHIIPSSIELLPGRHTIVFTPYPTAGSGSAIIKDINVEAGKTYKAKMGYRLTSGGSQYVGGGHTIYTSRGDWWVELTETK